MGCPELEELLLEGTDGHAAHCEGCRALLDAWHYVDATLNTTLAPICAPPGMAPAVRARVSREQPVRAPSLIPEILDLIGWAAVLAAAAIVIPRFLPLIQAVLAGTG